MRRFDREITDFQELITVMRGSDVCRLALHDGGTEYGAQFEEATLPWAKRALYTILSVVQRPIRHLL